MYLISSNCVGGKVDFIVDFETEALHPSFTRAHLEEENRAIYHDDLKTIGLADEVLSVSTTLKYSNLAHFT